MSLDPFADFSPFERREHEIEIAARNIVALARSDAFGRGWRPKGIDEVAILLESLGYSRDVVAELWYPDLFALARDVTGLIDKYVTDEERAAQPDLNWFKLACRDYAAGALYSGPWIIAVIGLAVFGASLWSSLSTPLHLATAIALGVYGAQLVSGFFAQAVARRLTFYFLADNLPLMRWTFDRLLGIAILTSIVAAAVLWIALRGTYGEPDALLAAAFCLGSSVFQLSLAPLYTLRRFAWIIGVAAFATLLTGITFVIFFHRQVNVPWEPATLATEIGLVGTAVLVATRAWLAGQAGRSNQALVPPSTISILLATLPYAVFGVLYFAAIICDRVFAGFVEGHGAFFYASSYELGADIALLAIIPVTGVSNVILEALPRRILAGARVAVGAIGPFQRAMTRFYFAGIAAIAGATLLAIGIGELVGPVLVASAHLGNGSETSLVVLRWTTVGYAIVMIGLLNVQVLFFLSRPRWAVIAAGAALASSIAWGAVALFHHAPAASMSGGLVCAAVIFAGLTTFATYRSMRRFIYAYYAAY